MSPSILGSLNVTDNSVAVEENFSILFQAVYKIGGFPDVGMYTYINSGVFL
jgi:hypothetical protein